jgi:hypothetical protein
MMTAMTAPEAFVLPDTYEPVRLIARRTELKAGMPSAARFFASRPPCVPAGTGIGSYRPMVLFAERFVSERAQLCPLTTKVSPQ